MHVKKLKFVLEQVLFATHVFVLVILLAENSLVIPDWLHVVGRLHPLVLHFPIVILLMAIVVLMFPRILKDPNDQFYYGHFLLLLGCVFSAITVIAGFFLSLEGDGSSALANHKWTGFGVFWLASLLYWTFDKVAERPKLQKTLASLVGILIIVTGHFGASLTHGEDFITAPLSKGNVELVSLKEAEAFDHVILPILENKCISCHKASKKKGGLRLDLAEHLLKGGESGPALVPGDLEKSLLAHRIFLPVEDEDHMPPKGKPQLTEEEKELIAAWIESGGEFGKKLITYAPETPIFQLASQRFENIPKTYSFKAADPEKIKSLNSFYRKVITLDPDSPALSVGYFSRQNFETSSLKELHDIKEQIVELNLNNMPVEDADLEALAVLTNLERLYLNFANIRGEGLKHLVSLKSLYSLSLAGNELDDKAIVALGELKSLEKLYLWNTGLAENQIARVKESLPNTYIETGFVDDGTVYQLNKPKLIFDNAFFQDRVKVEISHPIQSTEIHYTLDGTFPDSSNFILYKEPIYIDSNSVLRARAFADGWTGSEETGAEFIKASIRPVKYFLKYPPADRHKGDLVNSLFDGEKGIADGWNLAWLGFIHTPLEVEMEFEGPQKIESVDLSIWYNNGGRFFPPSEVEIWTVRNGGDWEMSHRSKPATPGKDDPSELTRVPIPFSAEGVEKMRLIAKPAVLPSWHRAAGEKAWIMIDELVIN